MGNQPTSTKHLLISYFLFIEIERIQDKDEKQKEAENAKDALGEKGDLKEDLKEEKKEIEDEKQPNLHHDADDWPSSPKLNTNIQSQASQTLTYVDEFGMTQTYVIPAEEIHSVFDFIYEPDSDIGITRPTISPPIPSIPIKPKKEKEQPNLENEEPIAVYFKSFAFPIPFRRLFLLSLMDKDSQFFISIPLAILVAWLAYEIRGVYTEFQFGVLWFVVATCHYSLLKSPQPGTCYNLAFLTLFAYHPGFLKTKKTILLF